MRVWPAQGCCLHTVCWMSAPGFKHVPKNRCLAPCMHPECVVLCSNSQLPLCTSISRLSTLSPGRAVMCSCAALCTYMSGMDICGGVFSSQQQTAAATHSVAVPASCNTTLFGLQGLHRSCQMVGKDGTAGSTRQQQHPNLTGDKPQLAAIQLLQVDSPVRMYPQVDTGRVPSLSAPQRLPVPQRQGEMQSN